MTPEVVTIRPETGSRRRELLFIHGAWHASWCWERFLPWFAERGWTSHALDLRGHGATPNDRSLRFTRLKHYVADLAAVVESLESPPILIGHSMGALVAQRYLEEASHPGTVLLAPVPVGGVWRATLRVLRRHPIKFLKGNLLWDLKPLVEDRGVAADLFFPDDMPAGDVDRHWKRLQAESYLAYLDMLFLVRPRPQLVHTPVAIVAATNDRLFGLKEIRRTAGAYGVEVSVIEGAAHDLMLGPRWEQAAIAIAEAIEGF